MQRILIVLLAVSLMASPAKAVVISSDLPTTDVFSGVDFGTLPIGTYTIFALHEAFANPDRYLFQIGPDTQLDALRLTLFDEGADGDGDRFLNFGGRTDSFPDLVSDDTNISGPSAGLVGSDLLSSTTIATLISTPSNILPPGEYYIEFGGDANAYFYAFEFVVSSTLVDPTIVPAPAAFWLVLTGLAGLAQASRRRNP